MRKQSLDVDSMSAPTRLPAKIVVYCAGCDRELGESDDHFLGQPVRCPKDKSHLASVVKGDVGKFWLRVEAALLRWEIKHTPARWFNGWGGWVIGGRYVLCRLLFLLFILVVEFQSPGGIFGSILHGVFAMLAAFALVDVLVANISVAFIS